MGGISVSSLGSIDWCQKSLNIIFFITLTTLARTYHFLYRSAVTFRYEDRVGCKCLRVLRAKH